LKHTASKRFWECFEGLPAETQALVRRNYELLRNDPSHPSLQFKAVANGKLHSVREPTIEELIAIRHKVRHDMDDRS
jgi:hypothetical protein